MRAPTVWMRQRGEPRGDLPRGAVVGRRRKRPLRRPRTDKSGHAGGFAGCRSGSARPISGLVAPAGAHADWPARPRRTRPTSRVLAPTSAFTRAPAPVIRVAMLAASASVSSVANSRLIRSRRDRFRHMRKPPCKRPGRLTTPQMNDSDRR